jgi:hypothetical protein
MNLEQIAELIENMIVQHDYPGFEPRSLNLGLPKEVLRVPAKTFAHALNHKSVFVKLAALRWFQDRPGVTKMFFQNISALLDNQDEWVRLETVKAIAKISPPTNEMALKVSPLLSDQSVAVQKETIRALGKILPRLKKQDEGITDKLRTLSSVQDATVRGKAQKVLRMLGEYVS